jgi:hypothetical protein
MSTEPVALREILPKLRESRGAVGGHNIPSAHAACHRRDDFHPGNGGHIEMMPGGRIEKGAHPRRALLLDIALDQGTAIAAIDRHLPTLLEERLRDRLPSDPNRGKRRGQSGVHAPRATGTEQPGLRQDVLQMVFRPVVPEPLIEGIT